MTLKQIRFEISKRNTKIASLEDEITALEQAALNMVGADLQNKLAESGKGHGELTTTIDDVKLTYEVKATYLWDQGKLQSLWEALPLDDARQLIATKMSVPARMIEKIGDESVLKRVLDARTTKYSEPKISFK
jgi:hypothetical protein